MLTLPLSQLRSALPGLRNPANAHKSVALDEKQFRYGFGNAVSEEESRELFEKWTIPSPARPLFQAASANFQPHSQAKVDTANETRGPLLLTIGARGPTVRTRSRRSTLKQYRHSGADTEPQRVRRSRAFRHSITAGARSPTLARQASANDL